MKEKKRKRKPTDVIREARVMEIMQIRIDGAETWDCYTYVAQKEKDDEHPWKMGSSRKPLCERTIRNYVADADELIVASSRKEDPNAMGKHLAQRRGLYARAVNAGDISTALAVLRDLATLQDLYPAKRVDQNTTGILKLQIQADDEFYAKHRLEGPEADGAPTPGPE